MEYKNILTIIDELGKLIKKYKDEIRFKDIQIENLNNKIKQIEQFTDFYSKE